MNNSAPASDSPASPVVSAARCKHFGWCGGCARQDVPYDEQVATKEADLKRLFGEEITAVMKPIVPSASPWFYRNKMEFAFGFDKGRGTPAPDQTAVESAPGTVQSAPDNIDRVAIGLRRRGRFYGVVDLDECFLMCEAVPAVLSAAREWANANNLPAYHLRRHRGLLRYLVMREGKRTRELLVVLVTAPPPDSGVFEEMLVTLGEKLKPLGVTSFVWAVTERQADLAVGEIRKSVFGGPRFKETLGGVTFDLSCYAFFQPNVELAEKLLEETGTLLGDGWNMLVDLYAGVGGITLPLASRTKRAIGVELDKDAVADAEHNAKLAGIGHCQFVAEDALTFLRRFSDYSFLDDSWAVILDPPRSGMHPKMPAQLTRVAPPVIIYISCNPKKLAEDLKSLSSTYRLESATPYDFFPHTPHVELVAKLVRK